MPRKNEDYIPAIPPELLAHIFQLAQQPPEPQDDGSDSDEPPLLAVELLMSHVRGYWRKLAHSTGPLWRHITIDHSGSADKLRAYLLRAGCQTPLHVQLNLICKPEVAPMV